MRRARVFSFGQLLFYLCVILLKSSAAKQSKNHTYVCQLSNYQEIPENIEVEF